MEHEVEILLSDDFQEFARQLAVIAEKKKKRKAEFKELYDAFLAEIRNLDADALAAKDAFERWKKECQTNCGDG